MKLLFTFSSFFGIGTSIQAEAKVLLYGMQLCVQGGFIWRLVIESDSMLLVWILLQKYQCPWSISYEAEQILQLSGGCTQFKHCYREANKVVDILCNEGCVHFNSLQCIYDCVADLPILARKEYQLDNFVFLLLSKL